MEEREAEAGHHPAHNSSFAGRIKGAFGSFATTLLFFPSLDVDAHMSSWNLVRNMKETNIPRFLAKKKISHEGPTAICLS